VDDDDDASNDVSNWHRQVRARQDDDSKLSGTGHGRRHADWPLAMVYIRLDWTHEVLHVHAHGITT